jgi:hypothetical protein
LIGWLVWFVEFGLVCIAESLCSSN